MVRFDFPLFANAGLVGPLSGSAGGVVDQRLQKITGIRDMGLEAVFEYGSGGTTAKVYLQSSWDGVNWHDVVQFAFLLANSRKVATIFPPATVPTVATDGTLADDTIGGPPAIYWRTKIITTGVYATTFITVKGDSKK